MREMRNAYKIFAGKPEGKRPLGRPSCGWDDNIRIDGDMSTALIWLRTGTSGELL
jgi:hypothetical protein